MRWVVSQKQPRGRRILLIESGARSVMEGIIRHLAESWGQNMPIDLITCYAGSPAGLNAESKVFHIGDYTTPDQRHELLLELRRREYAYAGMICSAEPIMNKWKWWLAFRVPAKFFIINENGDYFWLNRQNSTAVRQFVLVRLGLAGAGALRTLARLVLFPFGLIYLLLYAGVAHLRRYLRVKLLPS